MLNCLVPMICAIPFLPFQTTSGLDDPLAETPPAGQTPLEANSDGGSDH
jgi:hypothetical protein